MNKIENPRNPTFITALTAELVDWSLFTDPENARNLYERRGVFSVFSGDFEALANHAVNINYGKQHLKGAIFASPSEKLTDFLNQNRPQTLFFEPMDISNLLTPESNIVVRHTRDKSRDLEKWQFTLNPAKYPSRSIRDRQVITLSRGTELTTSTNDDVSDKRYSKNPYLAVGFPADYDGKNVIFYPDIGITYGDDLLNRKEIEKQMIDLLGLKTSKIKQKLDFYPQVQYPVDVSLQT